MPMSPWIRARARVQTIRAEAGGDDAEALARLFDDASFPDDGSASSRMQTILDATEKPWVRGLQTGLKFSDEGFRGDRARGGAGFRDPWPHSRNQVGHFLTAVGLAFRPSIVAEPVLGRSMRAWLSADPSIADDRVGKRLTVGHELMADPGVAAGFVMGGLSGALLPPAIGLRGIGATVGIPLCAAIGGAAGSFAQQLLGFRRQYHRATIDDERTFDEALETAGPGPTIDLEAVEAALRPLFDRIDVHAPGNSHQDLRLSLLGWWLGEAVRRGAFTRGADVAGWVRAHLVG